MTLHEQWVSEAYTKDGKLNGKVWDKYLPLEQKIYEHFLNERKNSLKGGFKELSEQFGMEPLFFVGFLDGISAALDKELDTNKIKENSKINISFKWENLYKKMVEYKAEHLYKLSEWENIFTKEERERLYKAQKTSGTVVRGTPKTGRNDPCPCGSGKKYKKCCGQ